MNDVISGIIGIIAGGILAYIIGPYISERFRLKIRLAESYLAPFKEWCSNLYGELYEFNKRYLEKDYSHISDLQIITDYRELHETLRYAPKWIGKIKGDVKDNLLKLMEIVDPFWHDLENKYSQELPSKEDVKLFENHLKGLSNNKRQEIAQRIRDHLKDKKQDYSKCQILQFLDYLEKKIP